MNYKKFHNYGDLIASIHTLNVSTHAYISNRDIPNEYKDSVHAYPKRDSTVIKINPNKICGDRFRFSELKETVNEIVAVLGISEDYKITRSDLRFDSADPNYYKTFAKLNRYLISLIAVNYKVRNTYVTKSLFNKKLLSIAIKNTQFEVEYYDKKAESNGSDLSASRFEMRLKSLSCKIEELPKVTRERWAERWTHATSDANFNATWHVLNNGLTNLYHERTNSNQVVYACYAEFIRANQNSIFCKRQLIDLISMTSESKNPLKYAENLKNSNHFEWFSKAEIRRAVQALKNAERLFFNDGLTAESEDHYYSLATQILV